MATQEITSTNSFARIDRACACSCRSRSRAGVFQTEELAQTALIKPIRAKTRQGYLP